MTYDAIIFDSDGVLVEPTDPEVHRNAVRKAFVEFGVTDVDASVVERLVEISGDERDELSVDNVRRICDEYGIDPDAFWRRRELLAAEAQHEEIHQGRKSTYPDVDVVHALGASSIDLSLGVISNNQEKTLLAVLERFDLSQYFDEVYGRPPTLDGIERRKPNVHYTERAIEEIGSNCPLVVGDSLVDVQSAERLGVDSVFVNRDHREDYQLTTAPTFEIRSLDELRDIVFE